MNVELEMTFTDWASSCKDPLLVSDGDDFRECRRQRFHSGAHASGFGGRLVQWDNETQT